jgi:dienelactone hydrolase
MVGLLQKRVFMKKFLLLMYCVFVTPTMVFSTEYKYAGGDQKFEGAFLKSNKKNSPAILMIHNWMGVTAETLKQAEKYHKLGYNVFVADIYGAGLRPRDSTEAGKLATIYKSDRKLFRGRIAIAYAEMLKQKNIDSKQTAVIGYCFGGTGAMEAARSNSKLKAAISFHGGLDSLNPTEGANIKANILVLHGADDPYVAAKDLDGFEKEMRDHHVQFELIKFSNAVHSFTDVSAGTDNSKGAAYNKTADEKSFEYTKMFLADSFKK